VVARQASWKVAPPSRRRRLLRRSMVVAVLLLAAEVALRLVERANGGRLPGEHLAASLKLTPGSQFAGRSVNRLGYWDDEFQAEPPPGVFRVAVLGDGLTLSGSYQTNCLSRLEQSLPGIEICHFGLPRASPREYAAQFVLEVADFQPHLVLAFFSVCDDVTGQSPPHPAFDWRGVRLARLATAWLPECPSKNCTIDEAKSTADYEEYLRQCAQRLAVCRTPINNELECLWRQSLGQIGDLLRQCRRRELPLALVVVPAEYQVDRRLCATLSRRASYESGQIDLELPQRRLAQFAFAHELPLIDLLPHLRASEESPYLRQASNWNDVGHALAGQALRGWLQAHFGENISAVTRAAAETAMRPKRP
jgi:hypothetical protein